MSAPAAAAKCAVATLMPPSISSSTASPRSSTIWRAARILSSTSGMNDWPPKPGWTLMNSRMSISSRYGSTTSSGVSGLCTSPTRMPCARIRSNSGRGSPSSTCTVQESAPAFGEVVEQVARVVDHQVAVEVEVGARAQALHDRCADREVRHEVPVHHVDVQEIGLRSDPLDLVGQLGEVRREDRRGDLSHARDPEREGSG